MLEQLTENDRKCYNCVYSHYVESVDKIYCKALCSYKELNDFCKKYIQQEEVTK